jgi:hypothetical protein
LQELYSMYLEQSGCKVELVSGVEAAMQQYCKSSYDVVLFTDLECMALVGLIRDRSPEQAIALVGTCGATGCRFKYRIPILRVPFVRRQLSRLVESAVKPQVRILLARIIREDIASSQSLVRSGL